MRRSWLAARNKGALKSVVGRIQESGGQAATVVADVSVRADVEGIAAAALAAFGRIDTWVNNAGVGIFGRVEEVTEAEHRRLFDVNYFGTVHGSLVAVERLRERGGAIVNLGSILSEVSVPLQGPYCASKAAVRGFTDALRQELEHEGAPISVSLVKPAAIATPFAQHARNYMDREPTLPPPLYAPEDAATVILQAAEHGGRDLTVGGGARVILAAGQVMPGAVDWAASRFGPAVSKRKKAPTSPVAGNLFAPGRDGEIWGETPYPVMRAGNAAARRSPALAAVALMAAGAATAFLRRRG